MGNEIWMLVGVAAIIIGGFAIFGSEEVDEYVPLLGFQYTQIFPSSGLDGITTIKEGGSATITVNVKSLSNEYQGNGRVEVSFEHDDALQYFEIKENIHELGSIPRQGATSGPLEFTITAIKDPGSYEDIVLVKLFIDNNLNDESSFKLKIE